MRNIIGLTIVTLSLSGCLTGDVQKHWRAEVLKTATFDYGAHRARVTKIQQGSGGTTRYKVWLCTRDKQHKEKCGYTTYVCADATSHRTGLDIMMVGSRTFNVRCNKVR